MIRKTLITQHRIMGIYKMHNKEVNIKNRVYNYYFDNLIIKYFNQWEKNHKNLVIYFTRYVHGKSIKMLSLHCHELMGKIQEHERKKY